VINRFAFLALAVSAPAFAQAQQQAPAPQPIVKATFVQRIDAGFNEVDTNKDGFSDRSEIVASETKALNARKQMVIKQREAAFKELDTNNNGSLTLQEFNAKLVAAPIQADAAPVLAQLDKNKDGKVSKEENRAPAVASFDRLDTNKDGTLSVAEQQAAAQQGQGR
jgi:hypothetical protein